MKESKQSAKKPYGVSAQAKVQSYKRLTKAKGPLEAELDAERSLGLLELCSSTDMKYDLHSHTLFSDGSLTPEQLIDRAIEKKVDVLDTNKKDIANTRYLFYKDGTLNPYALAYDVSKKFFSLIRTCYISKVIIKNYYHES